MYRKITAPDGDRNFNELWEPILPLSPAERRLAELRRELGNAEGTQVFRKEQSAHKSAWLS